MAVSMVRAGGVGWDRGDNIEWPEVHTAQGESLLSLFIIPVQCGGEREGDITCKHLLLGDKRLAMAMQGPRESVWRLCWTDRSCM